MNAAGKDYRNDLREFLNHYAGIIPKSGLERITGISQKQLWHYSSGNRVPRPGTVRKIQEQLHRFAEELNQVHFV
jgi:hypothetical protein